MRRTASRRAEAMEREYADWEGRKELIYFRA
jgi:hypothetical protein